MEPDLTGRTLGHYEILGRIGAGGMGFVWKAHHRNLGTVVALKTMPPGFDAIPVLVERFRREAQVMARLRHPHIVQVTDFGDEDGVYYFAMEFIEGGTLAERITSGGAMEAGETVRLLEEIAAAVDYAHAQGVVHRDLKPANVLIGADGLARVLDFGLARILEGVVRTEGGRLKTASEAGSVGAAETGDALSAAGQVLGTLEYMSPEQRAGEPVDARTDVYALGVIAFEMLIGRRPRGIEHPHLLRAGLRPEVTETIHRTLGPPDARPRTAGHFVQQLRAALARAPAPILPWVAVAAALLFAGVAAYFAWPRSKPAPAPPVVRDDPPAPVVVEKPPPPIEKPTPPVVEPTPTFGLVVVAEPPEGGTIDRTPSQDRYESGTIVQLLAKPKPGYTFAGWEDKWIGETRAETVSGDLRLVAQFERRMVTIVGRADPPEGGRVILNPAGPSVPSGSVVSVSAEAVSGWKFVGWSDGGNLAAFVDAPEADVTFTARFRPDVVTLTGHAGRIWQVAFSADGTRLVSGGADRSARVWDLSSGRESLRFEGHRYGQVTSVAFHPDGALVLSGGLDKLAFIWDAATGEIRAKLEPDGAVSAVAWADGGRIAAVGATTNFAMLWDWARDPNRPWCVSSPHGYEINTIAFSPDGRRLITGSGDAGVRHFDAKWDDHRWGIGTMLATPQHEDLDYPTIVAWTDDGAHVVARDRDDLTRLVVWECGSWTKPVRTLVGHSAKITSVAAGALVAAAAADGSVRLWDAATGEHVRTIEGEGALRTVAFSPDRSRLATAGESGAIRVLPVQE